MAKQTSKRNSQKTSSKSDLSDKLQPGQIIAHFGKHVVIEDGTGQHHRCVPRRHLPPLVCGDRIKWHYPDPKSCVINELEERSSLLARPDARGQQKIIAANIDQILIINAPFPAFNEGLLDRYLVASEHTGIHPVIVMNKSDLIDKNQQHQYQQRLSIYTNIGYEVIYTSVMDNTAFHTLYEKLINKTSILVGQSGVGKSSILNHLMPDINARVGELSESTGKGQHTTTTARLYPLQDNGSLIDSPGIREFGLWKITPDKLSKGFIEFSDYKSQCRFRNCMHHNEPGCAVIKAVEDQEISTQRYQSYLRILDSLINEEN